MNRGRGFIRANPSVIRNPVHGAGGWKLCAKDLPAENLAGADRGCRQWQARPRERGGTGRKSATVCGTRRAGRQTV